MKRRAAREEAAFVAAGRRPAVGSAAMAAPPAGLLALQRAAGNRATTALVRGLVPRATSLAELARARAYAPIGTLLARAGTPAAQAPPRGFRSIADRNTGVLGSTLGLTIVKGSGAFTPPQWLPGAKPQRGPTGTVWQPRVASTSATDVEHDCFYPAPGDHDRFADSDQEIDGKRWHHVLHITDSQSSQIKRGEQEHLDDAALAFRLSFGRIADAINEVSKLSLPAASSRDAAIASLVEALGSRLPGLGTDPAKWPDMLDRLLLATQERDREHWHDAAIRDSRRDAHTGRIIWSLDISTLRLGTPSSRVVVL